MMNQQFLPPGANNNAPNNPLGYPSQDLNGHQNANVYSQPQNGPQKPTDQSEMAQKMQSMNLNGPPGYNIPNSQLPPGQAPQSFGQKPQFNQGLISEQMPQNFGPNQIPNSVMPPQRPPNSMPQGPRPMSQPGGQGPLQMPPPGHQSGQFPSGQENTQSKPQNPPQAMPHMSQSGMPPMSQPGMPPMSQPGMPPMSQPGMPQMSQSNIPPMSQPGMPPMSQPGMPPMSQPGIPPTSQPGMPPMSQHGMPPISQPGMPPMSQPGMPPMSQSGMPPMTQSGMPTMSQPGMPPMSQPGMPPASQPGMPPMSQPGMSQMSQPGIPPMSQSGMSQMSQPGMPPMSQPSMPSQSQSLSSNSQQGMPPFPQSAQQSGMPPSQPGMPPSQPGMSPSQPGFQQSRMPAQMQSQGLPPQPGFNQPNMPGMPPSQGSFQPGQPQPQSGPQQTMAGLPHMPPPVAQGRQYPSQPQPGYGKTPGPSFPGQIPGQPPMPGQQFPGQPPMPGQQFPGQSPMPSQQFPGQPPMPGQQFPGQPPMAGQQMPGQPPMPGQQMARQPPMPGQMPGQPPMPGQQPSSGYPQQYQQPPFPSQQPSYPGQDYGCQQQQPQKRLDPDQMPSPIQVMLEDQQNRGGVFVTNEKGAVPPLVTTDFVVDDNGNASPRYIRSSMYSVPVSADLLKQTYMPFCLVISPMAETVGQEPPPPVLDFGALTGSPGLGPVRCSRCKAYMCPNMKFIDAGRHFKCAFCKATTEVPMEYTQYINSMQQYGRMPAEMALGTYEIVATKEYCRNNAFPNPPAIVFIIDVSYNSIKSGMLQTICENVLHIIDSIPKDEQTGKCPTRVGFITYSSTVHFYNIKGTLGQPQMLSVGDVGDMFVPLLEGFLQTAEDSGPVLGALLQQLPEMFHDNKETETILLPAVQAGVEALKAADTCGQLFVFHTSLPSYPAPGKLTNREDRKLLATDKEKQILSPQTTDYNELGQSCSAAGVSVEMFVCNNSYVDTATIGQLCRLTGGQLHKFTYFTADIDGPRLISTVVRVASRGTAVDAVMRVRTSTGVRPTDFYGHMFMSMFMSNTTDVELAAIDADKAIGVEIKHDDKLTAEDGVYIQAALLYTHRSGQRRLRVINLALNVAHQLADVYRTCELDTIVNFLTKQAVWCMRDSTPRQVRESLTTRCSRSLASYRKHCASPSSAGQLVLPESMKLLPLYTNCMLRGDAIGGGPDITCDDRSCAQYRALCAPLHLSVVYTYPRLAPLCPAPHRPLRDTLDKIHPDGVYLLENGVHMLLWIGAQAPQEYLKDVFGVTSVTQIDTQVAELPELDNPTSIAVRQFINDTRDLRKCAMRLTIMRQHDKMEYVLRHFLVEDRGVDGSSSYVDFLCHIHKEIRALL